MALIVQVLMLSNIWLARYLNKSEKHDSTFYRALLNDVRDFDLQPHIRAGNLESGVIM